jgi:phasin family protein
MQNELLEMVNQFNENVLNSVKRIGDINMRTFEQMTSKQAEIMNECLESTAKQYEVLSTAKDYKDAMAAQAELLKGCNEKYLANVRETAEMLSSVREEMTGMVEEAAKYTSESVEKASELAANKAA